MPHLAPHQLKGYIEHKDPSLTLDTLDLNIEFYRFVWSENFAQETARDLNARDTLKSTVLAAELLANYGPQSVAIMRNHQSYEDESVIKQAVLILRSADLIINRIDDLNGVETAFLPVASQNWSSLVEHQENAVFGRYLSIRLDEGLFSNYDVVGLSCAYLEQLLPALYIAKKIRKVYPDKKIIIGGTAFTHILSYVVKDPSFWSDIDLGVPFEGEHVLLEVLQTFNRGDDPRQANPAPKNIVWMDAHGIHYYPDLAIVPKTTPQPDFSAMSDLYPTPEPVYPLLSSKGCYWGKCSYCTHHEGYGNGYYKYPYEDLEGSIVRLVELGARSFYFVDEAMPIEKIIDISRIFSQVGGERIGSFKWMAEARVEKAVVRRQYIELLRQSGCRLLINGIESGSQKVLDNMRKGISLDKVAQQAKLCTDVGIKVGWMFFTSYPTETAEDTQATFDYIRCNQENVDFASIGSFSLKRGSPMWHSPQRFGIDKIINSEIPYQFDFEYIKNGEIEPETAKKKNAYLKEALRKNEDLKPIFVRAIDRATVLFSKITKSSRTPQEKSSPESINYFWHSEALDRQVRFNFHAKRFEVLMR